MKQFFFVHFSLQNKKEEYQNDSVCGRHRDIFLIKKKKRKNFLRITYLQLYLLVFKVFS